MNKKVSKKVRLAKWKKMGGIMRERKFEFREVEVEVGGYACDLGVYITIINKQAHRKK